MSKREKVVRAWGVTTENGTLLCDWICRYRREAVDVVHHNGGLRAVRVEIRVVPKARKKARKS
jgi:hypothetical protein